MQALPTLVTESSTDSAHNASTPEFPLRSHPSCPKHSIHWTSPATSLVSSLLARCKHGTHSVSCTGKRHAERVHAHLDATLKHGTRSVVCVKSDFMLHDDIWGAEAISPFPLPTRGLPSFWFWCEILRVSSPLCPLDRQTIDSVV